MEYSLEKNKSLKHTGFSNEISTKISQHSSRKQLLPGLKNRIPIPRGMGNYNQRYQILRQNQFLYNRLSQIMIKSVKPKSNGLFRSQSKQQLNPKRQRKGLQEQKLNRQNSNLILRLQTQKSYYNYRSRPLKTLTHTNHKYSLSENIQCSKEILYNRCKPFGQSYYYITIFFYNKLFKIDVQNIDQSDRYSLKFSSSEGKRLLQQVFQGNIKKLVEAIKIDKQKMHCQIQGVETSHSHDLGDIIVINQE